MVEICLSMRLLVHDGIVRLCMLDSESNHVRRFYRAYTDRVDSKAKLKVQLLIVFHVSFHLSRCLNLKDRFHMLSFLSTFPVRPLRLLRIEGSLLTCTSPGTSLTGAGISAGMAMVRTS
jgi:hypothetical protein